MTARILVCCAIGMAIGFGACSVGFSTRTYWLGYAALTVFTISLAGMIITALFALGNKLWEMFRR